MRNELGKLFLKLEQLISHSLQRIGTVMENLGKQERVQLKKMLLARDQSLREEIQREISLQNEYAEVASEVPDSGDLAFANLSMDIGNAAVARDVNELRAISYALKRLEGESYGECISCGYDIPFKRLMAIPTAERCAPCQRNFERTHHQEGMRGMTL
jgi:RNA polymerase-binding protein DksA